MAFEANNFSVAKKKVLPKGEINVDCNVQTSDNIEKVLSLSCNACVNNNEVLNGVVNYSGYVDVCVIYLTSEGEIGKINSTCPFTSKFDNESVVNGDKANICVKVIDSSVMSVNGDTVKAVCNLEENCTVQGNIDVKSIKSSDESVATKEENINVIRFVGDTSSTITVASDLQLREPIKRVIFTESQVLIKQAESGSNFISISGDMATRVLYLTAQDKFESGYVYDSFKEELELDGATRESQVEAFADALRDQIKITVEEQDKGAKISLVVPVMLHANVFENVEAFVVKDLYSTVSELNVTTESFEMTNVCPMLNIESKIDGNLSLGEESPRVDKILFIGGNTVTVSNNYIKDGEITIEGIARTNVIYLNDEENTVNSVQIEVPFVTSERFDEEATDGILTVNATAIDVDVVVKKGRELFYDAKIKASVNYCYQKIAAVITDVENLENVPNKDYGIELVFAKADQDSWDIAKELKVKEDMILSQNPEVVFPLQEDTKLVLFYQNTNG